MNKTSSGRQWSGMGKEGKTESVDDRVLSDYSGGNSEKLKMTPT